MQLTIVFSAALALALSGVRAQLPPQVTPCIEFCLAQAAAQDLDGCSVTDIQCLCANKKIQQDVFSCLQQQCTTEELEEVQIVVAAECAPPASSTSPSSASTHSEAPRPSASTSPQTTTHPASSSESHTSERTSAVQISTAPSTRLSSTTTVHVSSAANSTSLLPTTSATTPAALSTSSNSSPSASSEASTSTSSASPARTNAARRVGQDVVGVLVFGAVLGCVALW